MMMRKLATESYMNLGRIELWSPSTMMMFLSPPYASLSCWLWRGEMKSSFRPATNSAGM